MATQEIPLGVRNRDGIFFLMFYDKKFPSSILQNEITKIVAISVILKVKVQQKRGF